MPGCSGEPVVTTSCAFLFCTRDCGCSAHPAFPAPSILSRVVVVRKTRALSAPRDRGGVAVRELTRKSAVVMAGLVPAIHVFLAVTKPGRGSPGQAREAKLRRLPGDDAVVVAGYSPSLRGATRRSNLSSIW